MEDLTSGARQTKFPFVPHYNLPAAPGVRKIKMKAEAIRRGVFAVVVISNFSFADESSSFSNISGVDGKILKLLKVTAMDECEIGIYDKVPFDFDGDGGSGFKVTLVEDCRGAYYNYYLYAVKNSDSGFSNILLNHNEEVRIDGFERPEPYSAYFQPRWSGKSGAVIEYSAFKLVDGNRVSGLPDSVIFVEYRFEMQELRASKKYAVYYPDGR